jgi:hypothetical protein
MQIEESSAAETPTKKRTGLFKRFRGRNKYETVENYSILGAVFGALAFAGGIGLTALTTKGISVVIIMMGALISFLSSLVLVFSWLLKTMFVDED